MHPTNNLWLGPESLLRFTDTATWKRGRAIFLDQQSVLSLDIERVGKHWLLIGEVQGSSAHPYETEVELSLSPAGEVLTWDSDCSCPVGAQCKHGVALTIEAGGRAPDRTSASG